MKRREFLQKSAAATLSALGLLLKHYVLASPALLRSAEAESGAQLFALQKALNSSDALLLLPSDGQYVNYQNAFNLRTALSPQARVMVRTPRGLAQLIQWLRRTKVPFAIRGGGHSYEGFSQSERIVIDTRLMNSIELAPSKQSVFIGGGAALGDVYSALGPKGITIPAGSCPPVGVSGHVQGGGFGEFARPFGLACDSLLSVDLVNADGVEITASETENSDLFWAIRGGGGGSFGVATRYQFRTHAVSELTSFGVTWLLRGERALDACKDWQKWIATAPDFVTSFLRIDVSHSQNVTLHAAGLGLCSEAKLQAELQKITREKPNHQRLEPMNIVQAVHHFAGGNAYQSVHMKAKSDYLYEPLSDDGIRALFAGLQKHQGITATMDGYGGAIAKVAPTATAFAHRKALCCIQYSTSFEPEKTEASLASMKEFYDGLRGYMSGECYVNYPDLDLKNYAAAYWGENLARLKQIKASVDPTNFFQHAQSIPIG